MSSYYTDTIHVNAHELYKGKEWIDLEVPIDFVKHVNQFKVQFVPFEKEVQSRYGLKLYTSDFDRIGKENQHWTDLMLDPVKWEEYSAEQDSERFIVSYIPGPFVRSTAGTYNVYQKKEYDDTRYGKFRDGDMHNFDIIASITLYVNAHVQSLVLPVGANIDLSIPPIGESIDMPRIRVLQRRVPTVNARFNALQALNYNIKRYQETFEGNDAVSSGRRPLIFEHFDDNVEASLWFSNPNVDDPLLQFKSWEHVYKYLAIDNLDKFFKGTEEIARIAFWKIFVEYSVRFPPDGIEIVLYKINKQLDKVRRERGSRAYRSEKLRKEKWYQKYVEELIHYDTYDMRKASEFNFLTRRNGQLGLRYVPLLNVDPTDSGLYSVQYSLPNAPTSWKTIIVFDVVVLADLTYRKHAIDPTHELVFQHTLPPRQFSAVMGQQYALPRWQKVTSKEVDEYTSLEDAVTLLNNEFLDPDYVPRGKLRVRSITPDQSGLYMCYLMQQRSVITTFYPDQIDLDNEATSISTRDQSAPRLKFTIDDMLDLDVPIEPIGVGYKDPYQKTKKKFYIVPDYQTTEDGKWRFNVILVFPEKDYLFEDDELKFKGSSSTLYLNLTVLSTFKKITNNFKFRESELSTDPVKAVKGNLKDTRDRFPEKSVTIDFIKTDENHAFDNKITDNTKFVSLKLTKTLLPDEQSEQEGDKFSYYSIEGFIVPQDDLRDDSFTVESSEDAPGVITINVSPKSFKKGDFVKFILYGHVSSENLEEKASNNDLTDTHDVINENVKSALHFSIKKTIQQSATSVNEERTPQEDTDEIIETVDTSPQGVQRPSEDTEGQDDFGLVIEEGSNVDTVRDDQLPLVTEDGDGEEEEEKKTVKGKEEEKEEVEDEEEESSILIRPIENLSQRILDFIEKIQSQINSRRIDQNDMSNVDYGYYNNELEVARQTDIYQKMARIVSEGGIPKEFPPNSYRTLLDDILNFEKVMLQFGRDFESELLKPHDDTQSRRAHRGSILEAERLNMMYKQKMMVKRDNTDSFKQILYPFLKQRPRIITDAIVLHVDPVVRNVEVEEKNIVVLDASPYINMHDDTQLIRWATPRFPDGTTWSGDQKNGYSLPYNGNTPVLRVNIQSKEADEGLYSCIVYRKVKILSNGAKGASYIGKSMLAGGELDFLYEDDLFREEELYRVNFFVEVVRSIMMEERRQIINAVVKNIGDYPRTLELARELADNSNGITEPELYRVLQQDIWRFEGILDTIMQDVLERRFPQDHRLAPRLPKRRQKIIEHVRRRITEDVDNRKDGGAAAAARVLYKRTSDYIRLFLSMTINIDHDDWVPNHKLEAQIATSRSWTLREIIEDKIGLQYLLPHIILDHMEYDRLNGGLIVPKWREINFMRYIDALPRLHAEARARGKVLFELSMSDILALLREYGVEYRLLIEDIPEFLEKQGRPDLLDKFFRYLEQRNSVDIPDALRYISELELRNFLMRNNAWTYGFEPDKISKTDLNLVAQEGPGGVLIVLRNDIVRLLQSRGFSRLVNLLYEIYRSNLQSLNSGSVNYVTEEDFLQFLDEYTNEPATDVVRKTLWPFLKPDVSAPNSMHDYVSGVMQSRFNRWITLINDKGFRPIYGANQTRRDTISVRQQERANARFLNEYISGRVVESDAEAQFTRITDPTTGFDVANYKRNVSLTALRRDLGMFRNSFGQVLSRSDTEFLNDFFIVRTLEAPDPQPLLPSAGTETGEGIRTSGVTEQMSQIPEVPTESVSPDTTEQTPNIPESLEKDLERDTVIVTTPPQEDAEGDDIYEKYIINRNNKPSPFRKATKAYMDILLPTALNDANPNLVRKVALDAIERIIPNVERSGAKALKIYKDEDEGFHPNFMKYKEDKEKEFGDLSDESPVAKLRALLGVSKLLPKEGLTDAQIKKESPIPADIFKEAIDNLKKEKDEDIKKKLIRELRNMIIETDAKLDDRNIDQQIQDFFSGLQKMYPEDTLSESGLDELMDTLVKLDPVDCTQKEQTTSPSFIGDDITCNDTDNSATKEAEKIIQNIPLASPETMSSMAEEQVQKMRERREEYIKKLFKIMERFQNVEAYERIISSISLDSEESKWNPDLAKNVAKHFKELSDDSAKRAAVTDTVLKNTNLDSDWEQFLVDSGNLSKVPQKLDPSDYVLTKKGVTDMKKIQSKLQQLFSDLEEYNQDVRDRNKRIQKLNSDYEDLISRSLRFKHETLLREPPDTKDDVEGLEDHFIQILYTPSTALGKYQYTQTEPRIYQQLRSYWTEQREALGSELDSTFKSVVDGKDKYDESLSSLRDVIAVWNQHYLDRKLVYHYQEAFLGFPFNTILAFPVSDNEMVKKAGEGLNAREFRILQEVPSSLKQISESRKFEKFDMKMLKQEVWEQFKGEKNASKRQLTEERDITREDIENTLDGNEVELERLWQGYEKVYNEIQRVLNDDENPASRGSVTGEDWTKEETHILLKLFTESNSLEEMTQVMENYIKESNNKEEGTTSVVQNQAQVYESFLMLLRKATEREQ